MCPQANLALCCKAMLPILCMGHVSARLDKADGGRPLTQLSHCLREQPNGVSHLRLASQDAICGTHQLVNLRCAHTVQALPACC